MGSHNEQESEIPLWGFKTVSIQRKKSKKYLIECMF